MSLIAEYKASLKNIIIEEYVDLFFFRPLAFLFVKSIYRTSLTPNQVTMLSMLVGIGSGILIGIGGSTAILLGAMLLALATILDCADGQLARMKNNGTAFGRILDGVVDYVYTVSAFFGIAIGCRSESINPLLWWLFVVAAGASYAVQAALLDYYRNEFLARLTGRRGFVEDELREVNREQDEYSARKGHYLKKLLLFFYVNYTAYQIRLKPRDGKRNIENPREYVKRNSLLIRLWALNGTSTHVFVLLCCAAWGRLDIFLWYILGFGSLYSLLLYTVQRLIEVKNR
jgi:phosphatidylglycerophosphate synthase